MGAVAIISGISQVVLFSLFNYFGFILIERLLKGRVNKRGVYALLSFVNGGSGLVLLMQYSLSVTYLAAFLIMVVEIILLFNSGTENVLYGAMAIVINSMCLHGMVAAATAWVHFCSFSAVDAALDLRLLVSAITSTLELGMVCVILWKTPLELVNAAIKLPRQKSFMLLWMGICLVFMFASQIIYRLDYVATELFVMELLFCLMLLMSCYFMLLNTYKINQSVKIMMENRELSSELGNQKLLQSAFLKDSVFYIEVNLTQNKILAGSEIYMQSFENSDFDYELWFKKLEMQVHPDDREFFKKLVNRDNLLELAETGVEPPTFIYRRDENGKYRWIKMHIRLFKSENTGETMGFGYSLDVDADINREKELLEKSKTDCFTGLLNKATTQSMIREQIRHGVGALYIMDIDNFKQVNDTLGHEVGDQILKYVANTLKSNFAGADIVGRVGGDEFMAYSAGDKNLSDVSARAEELLCALSDEDDLSRPPYDFTASLGVTLITKLTADFPSAYRQADLALYDVKHGGKNSFSVYGVQHSLFDYA